MKMIKQFTYRQSLPVNALKIAENKIAWDIFALICKQEGVKPDNHSSICIESGKAQFAYYYSDGNLYLCSELRAGDCNHKIEFGKPIWKGNLKIEKL